MAKIIVSGAVAYDQIMDYPGLYSDDFMPDKLHTINLSFVVDKLLIGYGGTAGNIAYSLALLGEKPELISTVGEDFERYRSHMAAFGIDPTSIHIIKNELTSSAYVITDKGDNQIAVFYPGAGGHPYDAAVEIEGREMAIISPGNLVDMMKLVEYYREKKFPYLYDPSQQIPRLSGEALKESIGGAHTLFVSDYEFSLISKKTGWLEDEFLQHVPHLVVTYGVKGSIVKSRDGQWKVDAVPVVDTVDPTGAGDAYRAGYIKGLVAKLPLEKCARLGSTVAAYVVENQGTQTHTFTIDEFKARYEKSYGEAVGF